MANKKYYIILAIVATLVLIFIFYPSADEIETYELKKTDFIETLSASGRVEAKNRIDMIFQVSGTIENIFAVEGQLYEKGQTLITLEKLEDENQVKTSELQVKTAQNNFKEIKNQYEIKGLNYQVYKTSLENAKLAYERNLKLLEVGGVSTKEIEDLALKVQEAEAKKSLAELEYQSYAPGGSIREQSLIEIENAKIQLEKTEISRNKKIISAPFDGQVLEIPKEKYSNVQNGEIAVVFSEEGSFITTDIDERDYQKVKVGQKAFIQFLNSSEILEGVVREVSPVIDRTKGTIGVRIDLEEETSLKTDIGVNVEIVANEFLDKIIIPQEFVFSNPERIIVNEAGKAKVFILEDYQKAENYYILFDAELEEYIGKSVLAKDLKEGDNVN